jgi:hypothetical protein
VTTFDLPLRVPRKPDGSINFDELPKLYWRSGHKHFDEQHNLARYGEWVGAIVAREYEPC